MEDKEYAVVQNILTACDELINGKFILADSKITKILKSIAVSETVYNVISECMNNFNFEKEFARARIRKPNRNGYFEMPEEKSKILAMVFCILVQIENGQIDFTDFLKNYFIKENMDEYKAFTSEIIMPFRNILEEVFTYYEEKEYTDEFQNSPVEEEKDKIDEYFHEIIDICDDIITVLSNDIRARISLKDDAIILAEAIKEAAKIKNLKLLNGVMIGFDMIASKIKSIRNTYKEMKNLMLDFYDYLIL